MKTAEHYHDRAQAALRTLAENLLAQSAAMHASKVLPVHNRMIPYSLESAQAQLLQIAKDLARFALLNEMNSERTEPPQLPEPATR